MVKRRTHIGKKYVTIQLIEGFMLVEIKTQN